MDSILGEIKFVAFNFAPTGYLPCNGALLPISGNQALFSLIGTAYGGDGVHNFAVPTLPAKPDPAMHGHYIIATQGIYPSRP